MDLRDTDAMRRELQELRVAVANLKERERSQSQVIDHLKTKIKKQKGKPVEAEIIGVKQQYNGSGWDEITTHHFPYQGEQITEKRKHIVSKLAEAPQNQQSLISIELKMRKDTEYWEVKIKRKI